MEKLNAIEFNEKEIIFSSKADLEKAWDLMNSDDNFIIVFENGKNSQIIISSKYLGRVLNSELILKSMEE